MIGIAALMFLAQPTGGDARDAPADLLIFATIGHSEWCPAGNVQIDLRTGDYTLIPRAARSICNGLELVRPILRGKLEATRLAAIREAWEQARKSGLTSCRRGESGGVVSNAGTPIMVLTSGARTLAAPQEYGCWSLAGSALYRVIDNGFEAAHQR